MSLSPIAVADEENEDDASPGEASATADVETEQATDPQEASAADASTPEQIA
jgi:hypothetical protein